MHPFIYGHSRLFIYLLTNLSIRRLVYLIIY